MKKKKVMHLMSTHAFSGAENVACQIINAFRNDDNFEMIYVSEIKENEQNLNDRNIKYYKLDKFNRKSVSKAIKDINPDIIHAHDAKSIIMASLFYRKAKIIAHIHGNHENMRKLSVKTFLLNYVSKRVDKFIWVSESSLRDYYFKNKVSSKSIVLYNVIDSIELYDKINSDLKEYERFDFIFLGRLSYPKNPQRLINIIEMLVKKKKDLKVAIVGNGEFEEEIRNSIREKDLSNNITMFGFVANPYKILNSSKLMVMTSRYEGTPMCALEAIALGIPIVSTPTDGLKDIITNGYNGFLSNSDCEIVNILSSLLDDESKIKELKNSTLERSKIINNISNYKNELINIYK